jgi:hypothetical protein
MNGFATKKSFRHLMDGRFSATSKKVELYTQLGYRFRRSWKGRAHQVALASVVFEMKNFMFRSLLHDRSAAEGFAKTLFGAWHLVIKSSTWELVSV